MLTTGKTVTMPRHIMQFMLEKHGGPTAKFFKEAKRWFRAKGFSYPKPPKDLNDAAPELIAILDRQGWHHDVTE